MSPANTLHTCPGGALRSVRVLPSPGPELLGALRELSPLPGGKHEAFLSWLAGVAGDHFAEHHRRTALLARELTLVATRDPLLGAFVECAGLVHDIGKLLLPADLLETPGPLTRDQRLLTQTHPLAALALLRHTQTPQLCLNVVVQHHERWDGAGYPFALSRTEILTGARLLALADAYDAMTTDRPHQTALGAEDAAAELSAGAGHQFDPEFTVIAVTLFSGLSAAE